MKFSDKAKQAIEWVENTQDNLFITGRAGTGKSTLLEHIRLHSKKNIVVLAPTGISAVNVGGETIHSFFTLKPGFELDEARHMSLSSSKLSKFRRVKAIAIDEVSMVRADLMDAIDTVLKRARDNREPFGGVQMIFFGDLFQLPPVVTVRDKQKISLEYPSPYFFDANVFTERNQANLFGKPFALHRIELDEIYRQKDARFIELLNAVRSNEVTDTHLGALNARYQPDFIPKPKEKYIHLVTTNDAANHINALERQKLKKKEHVFLASKTKKIAPNLIPNDEEITLCVGAQVMFICNDTERRWVNGTIGTVLDIREESLGEFVVKVEKHDGRVVEVKKHTWEISRYIFEKNEFKRDIMGSYTQIPLKLAWAITIHKSQGKTFDKVVIDFGNGTFAHGQTYVALSRCTTLKGIVLRRPFQRSHILVDPRIQRFCTHTL